MHDVLNTDMSGSLKYVIRNGIAGSTMWSLNQLLTIGFGRLLNIC